ncbi:MAG TPA: cytochrome c peroxidase [Flavitalea sp.]|nr:cytochrome c peroxidase [Flavitalea sp.]
MKHVLFVLLFIAAICFSSMQNDDIGNKLTPAINAISSLYDQHIYSLDSFLKVYPSYFYDSSYSVRQKKYEELAYYFKRGAGLMIYFAPDLYYKKLVSPFQLEKSDRKGFYGILPDNWLFTGPIGNEPDSVLLKEFKKEDSISQIAFIVDATTKFRSALQEIKNRRHFAEIDAEGLFDALRIELFRISTLDIANSDFIIEEAGVPSLNGSADSWLLYAGELFKQIPSSRQGLNSRWLGLSTHTQTFLRKNKSFNDFDRMYFIRNCLIPLSQLLNDVQHELKIPFKQKWSAIRSQVSHAYDKNVLNPDFFAPDPDAYYSAEKAKLGELLFFDPILSDNNQRACASCHKPNMAFTDGLTKSTSFEREKELARNSPTVINAGFQKKAFWDQRASSLEDQLDSVINNPDELHSSFENVIGKINSSPEYVELFRKAFTKTQKNGITRQDVKNAIGVYERTVNGLNSRFDQYMRGDVSKLSQQEINGFNLYMGKARCGTCHFAPLFNGTLPPFFEITDHHSLGVPVKDTMERFKIDPDVGLFKLDGNVFVKFSFKTPTIRNSALTAPYMHNGVYKTLEQVIDFYDHGGGNKFRNDFKADMTERLFLTLIPTELKLADSEKKDLVSFIHALNDTSAARTPKRLPELKGKYATLNKRIVGGEY